MSEQRTQTGVRRRVWPIAAVVAAVLCGVGGYAIGANGSGGDQVAEIVDGEAQSASGPAVAVDGPGGPAVAPQMAAGEQGAAGAESASADSESALDTAYFGGYGRTVYTGSGFSTDAGTAPVYGFDAPGAATQQRVSEVAAAFGVAGEPVLQDGYWMVGSADWTGPVVSVQLDGTASFSYSNSDVDPWGACDDIWNNAGTVDEEEAQRLDAAYSECITGLSQTLPSQEEADQRLLAVLTDLGVDPATVTIQSQPTYEGSPTRSSQAQLLIDGSPSEVYYWLDLAPDGLYSMSGPLAATVALGDYPIVSAAEAFERMGDPRFQVEQTFWPITAEAVTDDYVWTPPTQAPAVPSPGSPVAWPVLSVSLVSAEPSLMSVWNTDGSMVLAPAYEFTAADGATYQVIALAESALDFTAR